MGKYKFLYLIWLLPAYLLFLVVHQGVVYYSLVDTYENGSSYTAEVVEFDLKQIAAQTNGYVILRFEEKNGEKVQQKLSLPVEMAAKVQETRVLPVRYKKGAFQNIVMMPTYAIQKGLVLTNMAMAFVGFLIALFVAMTVHRYANKRRSGGEPKLIIERVDQK